MTAVDDTGGGSASEGHEQAVSAIHPDLERRLQNLERKVEGLGAPIIRDRSGAGPQPPIGLAEDYLDADAEQGLRERARLDRLPIPAEEDRERYWLGQPFTYWKTGLDDYDNVVAAARERAITAGRLYDFGGSTGRVFRHAYCQPPGFEVWSWDFKVKTLLWNQRYMPTGIRCFLNGFNPPLPLADGYFDIVTAFSVFTHIDDLELPWLLELRRIRLARRPSVSDHSRRGLLGAHPAASAQGAEPKPERVGAHSGLTFPRAAQGVSLDRGYPLQLQCLPQPQLHPGAVGPLLRFDRASPSRVTRAVRRSAELRRLVP